MRKRIVNALFQVQRGALKSQRPSEATMFMIIKQVIEKSGNLAKNQITENKQVNLTRKQRKKDVKMKDCPTMSFVINAEPQIDRASFHLATMLMKRQEKT